MNSNYNLVYPEATDYYNINVFNSNFSNLADGIDEAKAGGYKDNIIVAAYNSTNPLKSCADYTCTQNDCASILSSAITKAGNCGKVTLLDGDFYLNSLLDVRNSVHISGMGKFFTKLHKINNNIEAYLIRLLCSEITIDNMGFLCETENSNFFMIYIGYTNSEINSCFFSATNSNTLYNEAGFIMIDYTRGFTAIRDCIFEKYSNLPYIVRAEKSQWRGIMNGNFVTNLEGYTQVPVAVNLINITSYNEIDFGNQKTNVYLKGALLN